MSNSKIEKSVLFQGVSRPKVWFGADYNHIIMSFMLTAVIFLMMKNPFFLLIIFPLHMVGVLLFRVDPYFYSILRTLGDTKIKPYFQTAKIWGGAISFSPSVTRWNKTQR